MVFRSDNRTPEQLRPVNIVPDFISTAEGSALIEIGNTKVICTASIRDFVAAVSVGIVDGAILLDLAYEEDSRADVDLNFVMTSSRKIVEVQATAEQHPFDEAELKKMMDLAGRGIESLISKQRNVLQKLPLRH